MGKTALVIGGGIGGLAAARSLNRHGWAVTVRERASSLPARGTMLAMWPHALRALAAIDAEEAVRRSGADLGAHAPDAALRLANGDTLINTRGRLDLVMIARPDLLAALAEGVNISFDHAVSDFDEAGFDLIVGADGVHSGVRRHYFGERFAARSLGAVAWRGTVPGRVASYGEVWAPGSMFGLTPTGMDATNYYACVYADGLFDPPHQPRLRELFAGWPDPVPEVVFRLAESEILHHVLFETPRLPSYVTGRVALLGDAAHGMGPFLGRGACEALVDGVTLGECLANGVPVSEGLTRYDRRRRRTTSRLVTGSRWMGRLAMASSGTGLRNAVVRAARRLDRLADSPGSAGVS